MKCYIKANDYRSRRFLVKIGAPVSGRRSAPSVVAAEVSIFAVIARDIKRHISGATSFYLQV